MPDPVLSELVVRRAHALWDAPAKPAGLRVHRDFGRQLQADELPALVLDEDEATPELLDHSPGMEETIRFRAEIRVGGPDVERVIEQRGEIFAWCVTQIASDRTLGGLVERVWERERSIQRAEAAGGSIHALTIQWEALLFRSEDDPREPPEIPE